MRGRVQSNPQSFKLVLRRQRISRSAVAARRPANGTVRYTDVVQLKLRRDLGINNVTTVEIVGRKKHLFAEKKGHPQTELIFSVVELKTATRVIEKLSDIASDIKKSIVDAIRALEKETATNVASNIVDDRQDINWPTETFSEAHRARGVDIIQFLEDPSGWLPLIRAGLVTRPVLRNHDLSAERALANFLRGGYRQLPGHLDIPTKSQLIDRQLGSGLIPVEDASRLSQAWRYRQSPKP